ncbi:MAG TPA: hypothetical protein PKH29_04360 [Oscillospiraceae bacterium]|nr:hypothetical protein [Oscillospiraceae bacterium]
MPEIIKCYRQKVPAARFIGVKYGDGDRVNGGFGVKWSEWFQNNRFAPLETLCTSEFSGEYEDGGAYIGLMRCRNSEPFEYWIGMFLPAETAVPNGYSFHDFPAKDLGVCWVKGKEDTVYCQEDLCCKQLGADGMKIVNDEQDACWFFERYACPRFTTPNETCEVILDICFFITE